jgi:hypothetical protein
MHVRTSTASTRQRRWWWLLCALVFAVAAGLQVFLAVTMTTWWAWTAAVAFALIAISCTVAARLASPP